MSSSRLIPKYLILNLFAMMVLCGCLTTALADVMSTAFEQREKYKNETRLGDPDATKKFIDRSEDTSKLQGLNDASLVDQGQESLRSSEFGKFLQDSDEAKIEAINRYKINSQNVMLKNSLKIEEDPMSKTGGSSLGSTVQTTKIEIKKSCTEGVDFNVDVGLELVLEVEEEDYLGPLQTEPRIVDIGGDTVYNGAMDLGYPIHWKRNRNGWHIKQESYGWRIYLSNYLGIPLENIDETINFPGGARGSGGTHFAGGDHIIVFESYRFGYTYKTQEKLKRLLEKDEYWRVSTEGAERLAESNECYETGRVCIKSGVKTFLGKYDVTRPCWYEKISYRCKSEPKDGCAHLIKQDCQLKDSECEYQVGSICLRWKRNYLCGGERKDLKFSLADSPIYCLGGDCHTPTTEDNQDFANVAYLAALNEANKDCVKESTGLCKDPITIFPGQADGCKKIIVSFVDCCSSMKGWGQNVNLCKCSGGEKGLALKRDKGLCHDVGIYCHKKDPVFGTCLVKKRNFCCFGSKLARFFQEQGREQLGISWGSPQSPDCRPLTLDEFIKIDFSKIDLEGLFDVLLSKGKNNANKSFPNLTPGEIPDIQKEHMKTTAQEKRDIRRRAEEEAERTRLAKLEAERLEKERLARLERERLERLEKERLAEIARKKEEVRLRELAAKRFILANKVDKQQRQCDFGDQYVNKLLDRCRNTTNNSDHMACFAKYNSYLEKELRPAHQELSRLKGELAGLR
jgi:conjugal transfer mating pair stabilization protein TraN